MAWSKIAGLGELSRLPIHFLPLRPWKVNRPSPRSPLVQLRCRGQALQSTAYFNVLPEKLLTIHDKLLVPWRGRLKSKEVCWNLGSGLVGGAKAWSSTSHRLPQRSLGISDAAKKKLTDDLQICVNVYDFLSECQLASSDRGSDIHYSTDKLWSWISTTICVDFQPRQADDLQRWGRLYINFLTNRIQENVCAASFSNNVSLVLKRINERRK